MVTFQIKQQQPVDPGQFLSDKLENYKRGCLVKVEKRFLQNIVDDFILNNFSRGCKKIPISSVDEARWTFSWTSQARLEACRGSSAFFKAYWRSSLWKRLIFGARFLKLVASKLISSKLVMEFFRIFFFALKSTLTLFCLLLFFLLTMDVWTKFESKMTHTGMQTIVCEVFRV